MFCARGGVDGWLGGWVWVGPGWVGGLREVGEHATPTPAPGVYMCGTI